MIKWITTILLWILLIINEIIMIAIKLVVGIIVGCITLVLFVVYELFDTIYNGLDDRERNKANHKLFD